MCTVQYHEVKKVEGGRGGLGGRASAAEAPRGKHGGEGRRGAGGNFLDPFQQLLVKEQGEDGDENGEKRNAPMCGRKITKCRRQNLSLVGEFNQSAPYGHVLRSYSKKPWPKFFLLRIRREEGGRKRRERLFPPPTERGGGGERVGKRLPFKISSSPPARQERG